MGREVDSLSSAEATQCSSWLAGMVWYGDITQAAQVQAGQVEAAQKLQV